MSQPNAERAAYVALLLSMLAILFALVGPCRFPQ